MSFLLADLRACLHFWSRLPVPAGRTESRSFGESVRALPAAALVIAAPTALALLASDWVGLPSLVSAGLAIAGLVATSGAMHEDGLADTADGLWGGKTVEGRLAIMRDSSIGAFGAAALCFSIVLRAAALSALTQTSALLAAAALMTAAALSRTACLLPLLLLPPARADGAGAYAGRPRPDAYRTAWLLLVPILFLPVLAGAGVIRICLAALLATAAAYSLVPIARKKIGGQTGDIAGASQQAAEIAFLCVLSGAAA